MKAENDEEKKIDINLWYAISLDSNRILIALVVIAIAIAIAIAKETQRLLHTLRNERHVQ